MDDPTINRGKFLISAGCSLLCLLLGTMISANPDRAALAAEVKNLRGSPTIFVNGVAISPLMFFGWAESGDPALRAMALDPMADVSQYIQQVKLARDAGVHIYSFGISMSWPKPGEAPDFSRADQAIELTLACDPWGLLVPRFDVGPPEWWLGLHPEDRMLFDDGKTEGWSMASEPWRQDMLENLKAFVRHCEEKYGDRILGYHPAGGALTEGLSEAFGTGTGLDPLWKVLEDGVVVLGRYANGDVAAAAKWTPAGLRVYIGALHCPAKLLRNVLRASGVHRYSDSDDVVLTDGKFLGFIATSQGPKHLMFRVPSTVVRVLDGQEIARDVSSLDLVMELGETKLYLLKKPAG